MNEYNTEVYTENADFIDGLKVTPYDGELPKISKYADSCDINETTSDGDYVFLHISSDKYTTKIPT